MNQLSQVSWNRILQRSGLLVLALYLSLAGGKYAGRVLYPLVWVNMWIIFLGGLGWMVWRFLRKRPFPATPLDGPLLLWVAILFLSVLKSEDPRVSLERWVYEVVCVLVFYLLVDLDRAGKRVETWLQITVLAGSVFFLFGFQELFDWYRQWISIGGLAQLIPPSTIRIRATMAHANILAAYLNCLWPLVVARLLVTSKKWLRWVLGIYTGLCLVLLYFTSSRGGWLSALVAAVTLGMLLVVDQRQYFSAAWAWARKSKVRITLWLCAGLVFAGLTGGFLWRQVQHPSHPTGNPRGYIWQVAIHMFTQSPWLGTGPGTFPRHFLQYFSIPPGVLLAHAHQYLLDLLGESGLFSPLIGLVSGGVIIWISWRRWREETTQGRRLLAGTLATLAGLAVHSQFDVPQDTPLINILTAALLAGLISPYIGEVKGYRGFPVFGNYFLVAGWVLSAGLGLYSLWGFSSYQAGLDAARVGDWSLAREKLTETVKKDGGLSLYRGQKGIAEARLAVSDQGLVEDFSLLHTALADVEEGVRSEPELALGWANLAVLRWYSGDSAGALGALEQAIQRAPASAGFYLLEGFFHEMNGERVAAERAYRQAYSLQPSLAMWGVLPGSPIWNRVTDASPKYFDVGEGWEMLEEGNFEGAVISFQEKVGLNDSRNYFGLGLARMQLGQWWQAEKALETAAFIDPQSVEIYKALCMVYEAEGKVLQATECREKVQGLIKTWLTFGYEEFNLGYYQRETVPIEDLPVVILWRKLER